MPQKKKKSSPSKAETRRYILISNDDGITAPGIAALICALQPIADLVVVAPDGPRSGAACSITSTMPVSYRLVSNEPGLKAYACSGTPADCVKLALHTICERKPDLVVSGINLGNNASICTYYSGTIGAATEACLKGISSIAFSLDTYNPHADFQPCAELIVRIAQHVLSNPLPLHTLLNVNFPETNHIKGAKVCRMAMGDWQHEWQRIESPRGGDYYWLTGDYKLLDKGRDHDMAALASGYASIVPMHLDMTSHELVDSLKNVFANKKKKVLKT